MAMPNGLGFDVVTDDDIRLDAFMFGEGQGRIVVSCEENQQDRLLDIIEEFDVPIVLLRSRDQRQNRRRQHAFWILRRVAKYL